MTDRGHGVKSPTCHSLLLLLPWGAVCKLAALGAGLAMQEELAPAELQENYK